jgi:hypothetical protein
VFTVFFIKYIDNCLPVAQTLTASAIWLELMSGANCVAMFYLHDQPQRR